MKALICVPCSDVVAPHRNSTDGWRWCACGSAGVRWQDPTAGLLDVTSAHGAGYVRVLGLNNSFLADAVHGVAWGDPEAIHEEWRLLHDQHAEIVPTHYLFHETKRACWAVVIRPNETGDVRYVDFAEAMIERSARTEPTPASSTDRAAAS